MVSGLIPSALAAALADPCTLTAARIRRSCSIVNELGVSFDCFLIALMFLLS